MVQSLIADGARSLVVDLGPAEVTLGGVSALAAALRQVERCDGELVLKSPRANTLKGLSDAGIIDRFPVC
jgi:hypothetical protein